MAVPDAGRLRQAPWVGEGWHPHLCHGSCLQTVPWLCHLTHGVNMFPGIKSAELAVWAQGSRE